MTIVKADYEFTFNDITYSSAGVPVGDTIETVLNPKEWLSCAVLDALGNEWFEEWVGSENPVELPFYEDLGIEFKFFTVKLPDGFEFSL